MCINTSCLQGRHVLTGSWRASDALQIWDFGEGALVQNVPVRHDERGEFLYCAQFCDNNVVVAGGSGTNSVQAINVNTAQVTGVRARRGQLDIKV